MPVKLVKGTKEHDDASNALQIAAVIAQSATCLRDKRGSVIFSAQGFLIGRGFNSPPGDLESQRRCDKEKITFSSRFKSDKTCCVHAEQRAIFGALRSAPDEIKGSRIYQVRLDESGQPTWSREPSCTICSKLALDIGIAEFVLWHEDGITIYSTIEYNDVSYAF